jgi:RHS repeat-associated protein
VLAYLANGKLASRTNRAGEATSFEYDTTQRVTTVRKPLDRVSRYAFDAEGKVRTITNPLDQSTDVTWTASRHVAKVTQPTGKFKEYAYDANGYLTDTWDELRNRTTLEYEHPQPWLSRLVKKTEPKGTATPAPGDYEWELGYDARGNVTSVTDPVGSVSRSTYNVDGTIATTTDANENTTTYVSYDANGLPTEIRDAAGGTTRFGYDADGLLRWTQDALHAAYAGGDPSTYRAYLYYDSFGRLGRQSAPKSTVHAPRELIWSDVDYDANDNVVAQVAPYYGWDATRSGALRRLTYDAQDRLVLETGPDTSVDPAGERTQHVYDAAGRLARTIRPKGMLTTAIPDDHVQAQTYDTLDRVVRATFYDIAPDGTVRATLNTHYCYDLAGDLSWVTRPRAGLATVDCAAPAPAYTTRFEYDDAHRRVRQFDALDREHTTTYDENGAVVATVDAAGARTTADYDQRGRLIESREPFEGNRVLTTRYEYDRVGNVLRVISPRAWDVSADKATFTDFVTTNHYDALNRLVRTDLPTDAKTKPAFVHYAYDANGNTVSKSLPVPTGEAAAVLESSRSTLTYWDTGWIRTSKNPATARVHFDYTANGSQSFRAPESPSGGLDPTRTMLWTYYADGQTKEEKDLAGQVTSFRYDANGNTVETSEASGLTSAGQPPLSVTAAYDSLDRNTQVRLHRAGEATSMVTTYAHDPHGNVIEQVSNREEGAGGVVLRPGRSETFEYDERDLPIAQVDYGLDAAAADDVRVTSVYWPTGLDRRRTIERGGASGWTVDQMLEKTQYANGLPKSQTTTNGAGTVLESHVLSYETLGGVYVNGNRTRDAFTLQGPDASAPCRATACVASFEYDAADRLIGTEDGHGGVTTLALDAAGNVTSESVASAGATTITSSTYVAGQLRSRTKGSEVRRYFYTPEGNLSCVTDAGGSELDCRVATGSTAAGTVVEAFAYDYTNRLASSRRFADGSETRSSSYVYDPLDRVVQQVDDYDGQAPLTTTFAYVGATTAVAGETSSATGAPATHRTYGYDASGRRIGLTRIAPGQQPERFSYGHDARGSVSLLIGQTGTARASYGYSAYGEADPALTKGDPASLDALNAYRFSDRRLDPGSGTIDMGARRFAPGLGRFLQVDAYASALADLDLSLDPLTANRYALAGGNPISFVEVDGHYVIGFDDDGNETRLVPPSTTPGWTPPPGTEPGTATPNERTKAPRGGGANRGPNKLRYAAGPQATEGFDFSLDNIWGATRNFQLWCLRQFMCEDSLDALDRGIGAVNSVIHSRPMEYVGSCAVSAASGAIIAAGATPGGMVLSAGWNCVITLTAMYLQTKSGRAKKVGQAIDVFFTVKDIGEAWLKGWQRWYNAWYREQARRRG